MYLHILWLCMHVLCIYFTVYMHFKFVYMFDLRTNELFLTCWLLKPWERWEASVARRVAQRHRGSTAQYGQCHSPGWSSLLLTVWSACWGSLATSPSSRHFAPPNASAMCRISSCRVWRWGTCCCCWPALRWMPAATCQRGGCSGGWAVKSSPSFSSPRSGCLCSLLQPFQLTGEPRLFLLLFFFCSHYDLINQHNFKKNEIYIAAKRCQCLSDCRNNPYWFKILFVVGNSEDIWPWELCAHQTADTWAA